MNGVDVRHARKTKGWTQGDLAGKLGVTQPYVSMLERGRRVVPASLARKLVAALDLPASALPVGPEPAPLSADRVARSLGALGYVGFAHLRHSAKLNPAELLVRTLTSPNVEARLVEALPWVLVNYPALDWPWLVASAKQNDLQNRLGFLVSVARKVAQVRGKTTSAETLAHWEHVLENSRLQKEDAFSRDRLTDTERKWLRSNRSPEARHWNLLTNLNAEAVASAG